jgi:predicted amidohydrolase
MRDVRVALAQIAPKLGDLGANLAAHLARIDEAVGRRAHVVVFPELSLTGYHLADQVPELALARDAPALVPLRDASRRIDVVVGFVEDGDGHRFFNSVAYFSGGELIHVHRKVFLPTYGMFQEGREFARGERLRAFETPHAPMGVLVCEDLWHPTSAWLLAQQGAEVVLGVANGPTRGTRPGAGITSIAVWRDLLRMQAQFHTSFYVFVNRVGCEDGLTFGGGSMAVDPFGRVLLELPALDEHLDTVDLAGSTLRRARSAYPLLRDADLELIHRELTRLRRLRFDLPATEDAEQEEEA